MVAYAIACGITTVPAARPASTSRRHHDGWYPRIDGSNQTGTDTALYDLIGRSFYVGIKAKF